MPNKLVSVIIPVYNVDPWLDECIQSVQDQKYSNIEILLINDGSTDNCLKICNEHAKSDDRIKVVDRPHEGASAARNCGLEMAKGDCILFFDSDDYMVPELIDRTVAVMEREDAGIVVFGTERYHNGEIISCPKEGSYTRVEAFHSCMTKKGIVPAVWAKLFDAKLVKDIRFILDHNYVDFIFFFEAMGKCGSVYVIPDSLVRYRRHPNSICTSKNARNIYDQIEQCKMMYEYAERINENGMLDSDIRRLKIQRIRWLLGSYTVFYKDDSEDGKSFRSKAREDIRRDHRLVPFSSLKVKLASLIFRMSPGLFVAVDRGRRRMTQKI